MDLNAMWDQVAGRLGTLPGLKNVFDHPAESITPPAGVVSYPERVDYDLTYGRGMDRIPSLPVVLVVGKVTSRSARKQAAAWASGAGAQSVKAHLESGTYTAFDELTVKNCTFDTVTIAGIDYIAALFELDIAGGGNS